MNTLWLFLCTPVFASPRNILVTRGGNVYILYMQTKNIILGIGALALVGIAIWYVVGMRQQQSQDTMLDATPQNVTLSGEYVCLPHLDTTSPQTDECAFGLKTDNGEYYAVNFGASASSMEQFKSGQHITASGFVVIKEALSTDQWATYDMKGIFTITDQPIINTPSNKPEGKLDIHAVCEGALMYMTFNDGESAARFVAECEEGKHPEVIERFKAELNLGDGAAL